MIHAMDLAYLKEIGVTTNELDESSIKCPTCSSSGFPPSINEGQCEFCDGTFGGHSPESEKDKAQMAATMYGSKLYPYQQELLTRLMDTYFSDIENRIAHYTRGYSKRNAQQSFHQVYGGSTDNIINFWFDEAHHIKEFDWFDRYPVTDELKEKDWARTRFQQDTLSSAPSAAKRAKLRAKRKKRK